MANPMHAVLGEKVYHSIGHLPGSRVGPGDHSLQPQHARRFSEPKDYRERIAVTEKVDGTCVSVVCCGGQLLAVQRNGYWCADSPYRQHHMFAKWASANSDLFTALQEGDRIVGEWMAQAHGIVYDALPVRFLVFDIKTGGSWLDTLAVRRWTFAAGLTPVPLVHYGMPLEERYWEKLARRSACRTKGPAEGLVFRRELNGERVDVAKWVRRDHIAGRYLPGTENAETDVEVWNPPIE